MWGAERRIGPEACSEVGILLLAMFGWFLSLLQQWGDAQNQAFEAEGAQKARSSCHRILLMNKLRLGLRMQFYGRVLAKQA